MELDIGNYYGIGYRKFQWNWLGKISSKLSQKKYQNNLAYMFFVLQNMLYLASFLIYIKN